MPDLAVAIVWHHHQPYYPDDVGGENPMPWVRLHASRDYWGMGMLLDEAPAMRATVNFVPSLLDQLAAYEAGREDTHLRVSRLPVDGLSEQDLGYLLENFFLVQPEHNIFPYPRYAELYQKRPQPGEPLERARKRFSKRDLLDLQCWHNLVWIHPLALERDADLAALRKKGRHWSEAEKQWLLARQLELVREVVPLYRRLAERGQVELTTSPYYHPILPLLWDKRLARRAMPEAPLPARLESCAADARQQVQRAVARHEQAFGHKPLGLWPPEGAVCQGIVPMIAQAGIQWIGTDEEILSASTGGWIARDAQGFLRNPELLYRPWRVEEGGHGLQIVFRDHAMSDQIGFHYQRMSAEDAVADFTGRLEAIRRAVAPSAPRRPGLVSIILDGENCWEYYPQSGVEFLRKLYRRLAEHPRLQPVRVAEYLAAWPASDKVAHLFPGSWIGHNFAIWIGQPATNRAWDLLADARQALARESEAGRVPAETLARAWQELYIAEGSDWFWWFFDAHRSAHSPWFDRLFRRHLENIYTLLGLTPPVELARPIRPGYRLPLHSTPTALLRLQVDGRRTYFEWLNAGRYICQGARGAMAMAGQGLVSDLYFGFDLERLFVRLDARGGPVRDRFADLDAVRLVFFEPEGYVVEVAGPARRRPQATLRRAGQTVAESGLEAAADAVFELAIPFRSLGAQSDQPLQFFVELVGHGRVIERVPAEGAIETAVPSPDFEFIMWQA